MYHPVHAYSVMSDSATPWTVACQAPLSMGFSRQEYWSGLPCPPPGDLPNPGIESRSPTLQVDSLLSESPGEPKNTRVGSLSLLQGIFLTQELKQGLLNCRQSLHQLRYRGSPHITPHNYNFVCVVQIFKIYFLSKLQVYSTILTTIVTMLNLKPLELIHLIIESLYPLTNIFPFPPPG